MPHKMNTRSCERVNGLAVRAARLPVDGRRAGRRPVERGRRLLLGRPPGGAARRVLRRRRAVRDVPDRARRVRRLPGRDRARAGPLPAVPGHHQGADGRGAQRRRPRDRARGDQGARGRGRAGDARAGRRPTTTCSTGWPPTSGSGCAGRSSTRWSPTRSTFTGAASARSRPSSPGSTRSPPHTPRPRPTPRARSCEADVDATSTPARCATSTPPATTCCWSPPTASRPTTSCCRPRSPTRARCSPPVAVLVRPARRPRAQPRGLRRRPAGGRRAGDALPAPGDAAGRVRRARLPHRVRPEGLPDDRRRVRHRAAARAGRRLRGCPSRSSRRRPRRRSASTTRT